MCKLFNIFLPGVCMQFRVLLVLTFVAFGSCKLVIGAMADEPLLQSRRKDLTDIMIMREGGQHSYLSPKVVTSSEVLQELVGDAEKTFGLHLNNKSYYDLVLVAQFSKYNKETIANPWKYDIQHQKELSSSLFGRVCSIAHKWKMSHLEQLCKEFFQQKLLNNQREVVLLWPRISQAINRLFTPQEQALIVKNMYSQSEIDKLAKNFIRSVKPYTVDYVTGDFIEGTLSNLDRKISILVTDMSVNVTDAGQVYNQELGYPIAAVRIAPNGKFFAVMPTKSHQSAQGNNIVDKIVLDNDINNQNISIAVDGIVTSLATTDGLIGTGCEDGTTKIFDSSFGTQMAELVNDNNPVTAVHINDLNVAIAKDNGSVMIHTLLPGGGASDVVQYLGGLVNTQDLLFINNKAWLAAVSDKGLAIFDNVSGSDIARLNVTFGNKVRMKSIGGGFDIITPGARYFFDTDNFISFFSFDHYITRIQILFKRPWWKFW